MTAPTIIIPIYNDAKSLEALLRIVTEIPKDQVSFLIVDNGSTDNSVKELLDRNGNWTSVATPHNLGFGGGIMFGIRHCNTPFVGWMPGNLKVDPRALPSILSSFQLDSRTIIKATREGRSGIARAKTGLVGTLQTFLLQTNMLDSGGTPTLCSRDFVLSLDDPPTDYVFESFVLYKARALGMRVSRPKVAYGIRVFDQSHWQRGLVSELKLLMRVYKESRKWRLGNR